MVEEIIFNKIRFINGNYKVVKNEFLKKGGYIVFHAAPALIKIYQNKFYHDALEKSLFAILDSGYFFLILKFFKGIKVKKVFRVRVCKKFS